MKTYRVQSEFLASSSITFLVIKEEIQCLVYLTPGPEFGFRAAKMRVKKH